MPEGVLHPLQHAGLSGRLGSEVFLECSVSGLAIFHAIERLRVAPGYVHITTPR